MLCLHFGKKDVSIIVLFSAPFGHLIGKMLLPFRASCSCLLCHCSVRMLPEICLLLVHSECTKLWVCEYATSVFDLELFHMPPPEHTEVRVVQTGYTSGKKLLVFWICGILKKAISRVILIWGSYEMRDLLPVLEAIWVPAFSFCANELIPSHGPCKVYFSTVIVFPYFHLLIRLLQFHFYLSCLLYYFPCFPLSPDVLIFTGNIVVLCLLVLYWIHFCLISLSSYPKKAAYYCD